MRTSRAAVIKQFNEPLVIEHVPIPELEKGSLLMRIVASTLCGNLRPQLNFYSHDRSMAT